MTRLFSEILAQRPDIDMAEVARLTEELRQQVRAARLREIRQDQTITQVQLASELGVTQNRVSKIERGQIATTQVDTLRRYVEALGGTLAVEAKFGDTHYALV